MSKSHWSSNLAQTKQSKTISSAVPYHKDLGHSQLSIQRNLYIIVNTLVESACHIFVHQYSCYTLVASTEMIRTTTNKRFQNQRFPRLSNHSEGPRLFLLAPFRLLISCPLVSRHFAECGIRLPIYATVPSN